jgi:hypothetical protein
LVYSLKKKEWEFRNWKKGYLSLCRLRSIKALIEKKKLKIF